MGCGEAEDAGGLTLPDRTGPPDRLGPPRMAMRLRTVW